MRPAATLGTATCMRIDKCLQCFDSTDKVQGNMEEDGLVVFD